MIDDEPTGDPLDPDEVETTLAEQYEIDRLAFERAQALGRPVLVASFHGTGKVTVYDPHGIGSTSYGPSGSRAACGSGADEP